MEFGYLSVFREIEPMVHSGTLNFKSTVIEVSFEYIIFNQLFI